jgi:hypothetical protein
MNPKLAKKKSMQKEEEEEEEGDYSSRYWYFHPGSHLAHVMFRKQKHTHKMKEGGEPRYHILGIMWSA